MEQDEDAIKPGFAALYEQNRAINHAVRTAREALVRACVLIKENRATVLGVTAEALHGSTSIEHVQLRLQAVIADAKTYLGRQCRSVANTQRHAKPRRRAPRESLHS